MDDAQWSRCDAVLDDVRRLNDAAAPDLEEVERVLTDGYACVLWTEGERRRLRSRLEERSATIGRSPGECEIVEITTLARGIARADSRIEELRAALDGLAARARVLRVA